MASSHPLPTPTPAPPLNVPGLVCVGTVCGSNVNYVCQKLPGDCAALTRYEFEHLLKPHFWILAVLLFYIASKADSEDAYQLFLKALVKLGLRPSGRTQSRSRATQTAALLAYLVVLWLVWVEARMVLSTDWRMARKVLVIWRPHLTPLRTQLLMLYPMWIFISALCVAVVAFTIVVGVGIVKVQVGCVADMALLVMGRRTLDEGELPGGRESGVRYSDEGRIRDQAKFESTEASAPALADEKS